MAKFPQDVNFSPDFPTGGVAVYADVPGRAADAVDGVLAIDPVALSYMLKGAPGIDVGEGLTVTSDNLVETLLSTAYQKFDDANQEQRDDFLDSATSKVFSTVMSGDADPHSIVDGLRKAAGRAPGVDLQQQPGRAERHRDHVAGRGHGDRPGAADARCLHE